MPLEAVGFGLAAAGLLAMVAVPALKLAWREDIAPGLGVRTPPRGIHALRFCESTARGGKKHD